jgi:exosortase/archaeosortase family protein
VTIRATLSGGAQQRLRGDLLFAAVLALLIANAAAGLAIESIAARGLLGAAINLFDVGALIWIAAAAALLLLISGNNPVPCSNGDRGFAALAVVVALIPSTSLSAASLTGFGAWMLWRADGDAVRRRSALIVLSLSTFFFWGRLFLALGSGPLLAIDAKFVSLLSGLPAQGNLVSFANGENFMIAPGCSSLHGISQALILWTTTIAWFNYKVTQRLWLTLVCAIFATVTINGLRLAIIAWNPQDFDYWHVGTGAIIMGYAMLASIALTVFLGTKNASVAA